MSFQGKAQAGDKYTRVIGGREMPGTVMAVEGNLLYWAAEGTEDWPREDLWTFDAATGVEEDAYLEWGVKFGQTGSYLKEHEEVS